MAKRAPEMEPEVKSQDTPEGGTGIQLWGNTLFRNEDYNPDLQGQKGTLVYEKMRRGDPDVASGLSKIIWPLLSANWEFEPQEDAEEDRKAAAFNAKWILGVGRTDPFAMNKQAFLRHALLMVSDGFSAFEKVRGRDRDGRDVYAQLVPVLPKTIEEFKFSDEAGGGLEYALQRAWIQGKGFRSAKIRAEKLMLFVFGREGDNLFGWPILRAAYKPWLHKEIIEVIDGIRIERNGVGFFVITIPKGSKPAVRESAMKVASQIRVHERMGAVVEEGTTIAIQYPTGSDPKIVESLNFLRSQILQVLGSEFMEHGTGGQGSKALVGSKIELLLYTLQGLASDVCDTVNRQASPELTYWNWGNRIKPPQLKCDEIARMSVEQLAETLSKLSPGTDFIGADPEIKQHIRKSGKLPLIPEKDMKRLRDAHDKDLDAKVELAGQPPPEPGVLDPNADPAPVPKLVPKKPLAAMRLCAMSDQELQEIQVSRLIQFATTVTPLWREPSEHERHADFQGMKSRAVSEPKLAYKNIVDGTRATMARIVASRLVSMTDAELRSGDIPVPLKGKLEKRLLVPFLEAYRRGRKSIVQERARQMAKVSAIAAAREDEEDEDWPTEPTAEQSGWVKVLVSGFVIGLIQGIQKRATDEALTVRQAELPAEQQRQRIEKAILDLSPAVIQTELAGDMNRAFMTGRFYQAKEMREEITSSFYTAAMDDGTEQCEEQGGTCADLDGDEFEFGDPDYEVPNPNCAWPPNCRCAQVHVFREIATEEAA